MNSKYVSMCIIILVHIPNYLMCTNKEQCLYTLEKVGSTPVYHKQVVVNISLVQYFVGKFPTFCKLKVF